MPQQIVDHLPRSREAVVPPRQQRQDGSEAAPGRSGRRRPRGVPQVHRGRGRFPQQQQGITGYIFEPWHYRYLGVELAKEYTASGAGTLEEFFGTGAAPNYEES